MNVDNVIMDKFKQKFMDLFKKHNYNPDDYHIVFDFVLDEKPKHLWRFKILITKPKDIDKPEILFYASFHNDEGEPDFWKAVENELVLKLTREIWKKNAFSEEKNEANKD